MIYKIPSSTDVMKYGIGYITVSKLDSYSFVSSDNALYKSEYDKATITYPVEKVVYKTTTEKKQETVVDADGNTIILKEYEVEVPVLDEKGNPIISGKTREIVRYNKYDSEGVVIIPDDATILTEEQYKAELEKLKQTK